jgi:CTP-dependent riboflavin kinase
MNEKEIATLGYTIAYGGRVGTREVSEALSVSSFAAGRVLVSLEKRGYLSRAHVGRGRYWEVTGAGYVTLAKIHDVIATAFKVSCNGLAGRTTTGKG